MKLQIDVTVENMDDVFNALDEIGGALADGERHGDVYLGEAGVVGLFELLQPQENTSAC
jgi:hypothetical protein